MKVDAPGKKKRSLSNIWMTKKFHLRYLGLWVLTTVSLILLLNYLLYLIIMEQWVYTTDVWMTSPGSTPPLHSLVAGALMLEAFFFSVAVIYLGSVTSNRIAGPHIRLKRVCENIRDGETNQRLNFRSYDRLEDVEAAFNGMIESLTRADGPAPAVGKEPNESRGAL